jgi:hypothetical protein
MIKTFRFKRLIGQKFPKQNTKEKQALPIGKPCNLKAYGLESSNMPKAITPIIGAQKVT